MTRKRKTKTNRKQKTIEKSNGSTWKRRGWMIAVALGLVVAVYAVGEWQDPVPPRPGRAVSRAAPLPVRKPSPHSTRIRVRQSPFPRLCLPRCLTFLLLSGPTELQERFQRYWPSNPAIATATATAMEAYWIVTRPTTDPGERSVSRRFSLLTR